MSAWGGLDVAIRGAHRERGWIDGLFPFHHLLLQDGARGPLSGLEVIRADVLKGGSVVLNALMLRGELEKTVLYIPRGEPH
jgi:hypothetical protein